MNFNKLLNRSAKIVLILLIVCLNYIGLSAVRATVAYYNDIENSSENFLDAGTLNLEISPDNFDWQAPLPSPGSDNTLTTSTIQLTNAGSLDFRYRITIPTSTGDLCQNLKISTSTASAGVTLNEFNLQGEINSGNIQEFNFKIYLNEDVNLYFHEKESCNFKFSISAWQKEPEGIDENTGFNDSEEIPVNVSLTAHYKELLEKWLEKLGFFTGNIVINEFLPIAEEFPEFIELYNKGDSTTSISGWEVCYTDKFRKVLSGLRKQSNWCERSVAIGDDAAISPGGFYVIYLENNWIGDNKGIISLWNPGNILSNLVDAHAYDKNWRDTILSDKSFARIPDGSPNWYDPIPTPGGPNKLLPQDEKIVPGNVLTEATTTEATTTTTEATTTEPAATAQEEATTTEVTTAEATTAEATTTEATTTDEAATTTTDEATTTDKTTTTTTTTTTTVTTEATTTDENATATDESVGAEATTSQATTTEATTTEPAATVQEEATTTEATTTEATTTEATTTDEDAITTTDEAATITEEASIGETTITEVTTTEATTSPAQIFGENWGGQAESTTTEATTTEATASEQTAEQAKAEEQAEPSEPPVQNEEPNGGESPAGGTDGTSTDEIYE